MSSQRFFTEGINIRVKYRIRKVSLRVVVFIFYAKVYSDGGES